MKSLVTLESVIEFIQDEGLGPHKVKHRGEKWTININEPSSWGTCDKKFRCGISTKVIQDKEIVVFNGFKAAANIGSEYKGDFFNFVKLVKGFDNRETAKNYFTEKYLLNQNIQQFFDQEKNIKLASPVYCNFPDHFERFDKIEHQEYYKYLINKRKIDEKRIDKLKLFVDVLQKRIVFPVYENGDLIFYAGRDITGRSLMPWLKSEGEEVYPVWNLENIVGSTVTVFEGIGDAVHVSNGVALFGIGSEEQLLKIKKKCFSKIILIFDNDTAGWAAKSRWADFLSDYNQNVYVYDYSGITEKDFGKMKENGVLFEINKRIFPWTDKTKMLMRMGRLK